jgi:DNA topoisomerase-1
VDTTEARAGLRRADPTKDAARLKALRIPPAWKDVHLSRDPDAALQATGVDVKGRTQYKYSAEHSQAAAAEKFARVREFNDQLPALRKQILGDLTSKDPDTRDAAAVLYLIDKTGFRPGSERETLGDKKAYGATTLTREHVTVDGNQVHFSFTGKKGVQIDKTVEDARLARLLRPRLKREGPLFDASDASLRAYMQEHAPGFKPKDFRTHSGTAAALRAIKAMPTPKNPKEYKKAQREVAQIVAEHLGNTPAIALTSYIDPAAFSRWKARAKVT